MLTDNKQEAIGTSYATEIQTAGVFILTTCIQGSLMAAAHTTRERAMEAAVDWAEGDTETMLSGRLEERYEQARRHVEGQGGRMEIIGSPIFGPVQ